MEVYYKFSPDGLLVKCKESELEKLGGLKYVSETRAYDYSGGLYNESGWMAYATTGPSHYASSDDLGTQGVLNPADGKRYDSRSAYYQAVKDKGLVILGDDAPVQKATPKVESVNWEKAVAETLKSTPLKGKKR